MIVFDKCSTMNSLYAREGVESFGSSTQHEEDIVLHTVDRYGLQHGIEFIDLVKMDVEGHEVEACKGMIHMLRSGQVGAIQLEYGGCNIDARALLKDIFALFRGFHWSFYKIYPKELRLVPRHDQRLENFQ
ncbi:MAG TPA: FkbM family methyltransferase, partial [Edaphobacter sp.]|uniref:FkbM family methyltransferase n=1 Tax=Edaphobacter sp. TaxID=1934404 RepID=UPI002C97F43C